MMTFYDYPRNEDVTLAQLTAPLTSESTPNFFIKDF